MPETLIEKDSENSVLPSNETFDQAFQSLKTASVISVNSLCYPSGSRQLLLPLETLTEELLLGTSDLVLQEQKPLEIAHIPALATLSKGRMKGQPVMIKTVVLKQDHCLYDLIYIAKPSSFDVDAPTFEEFVLSLKIK